MTRGKTGTSMTTFRIPRKYRRKPYERADRFCPKCLALRDEPCREPNREGDVRGKHHYVPRIHAERRT